MSNTGWSVAITSGAPAATIKSFLAAAASGRPNTGAETKCCTFSSWARASRSASPTLIVLMETWVALGGSTSRMPSLAKTTASTAASSASMVMTASPPAACPGVSAFTAPALTSGSVLAAVRLCTVRTCGASSRLAAMALPIRPSPTKPSSIALPPSSITVFRPEGSGLDQVAGLELVVRFGLRTSAVLTLRPIGRVTANLILQVREIDKLVGLASQFVGHHRGVRGEGRDDAHAVALELQGLDQRAKIAVAREQDKVIEMFGEQHGIDRKLDIHIAFDLLTSRGVDELLGRLRHHGVAVVIEPIDQWPDRGIFLILGERGVVERAHELTFRAKHRQEAFVIDIEGKRLGGRI